MQSDFYPQLVADLQSLMMSVWSLGKSQIMTTNQAISDNIVQQVLRSTPGNPQFDPSVEAAIPLGILQVGDFRPTTSYGINNDLYWAPIAMWYLMIETDQSSNGMTNQQIVNNLLYQMGYAIRNNSPQPGAFQSFLQVDADGFVNSSESEPLNQALRGNSRISIATGSISWTPGLLVGDSALP